MTASPHVIDADEQRPLAAYAGLAAVWTGLLGGGLAAALRHGRGLPETIAPGDLALYGVATHRLSRLISREKVARFA
nr:hypothetical protein [Solirubrobacterales bacterium]